MVTRGEEGNQIGRVNKGNWSDSGKDTSILMGHRAWHICACIEVCTHMHIYIKYCAVGLANL